MQKPFQYVKSELYCEKVKIKTLAKKFGTPLYVMSENNIKNQYALFESAFSGLDHMICYAIKANFNLSIIGLLARAGSGADVGGAGDLHRALKAGIPAQKIVMSGVGKTKIEIEQAIKNKILMIKVESISELKQINTIAKKLRSVAPLAVRINPAVETLTHAHISTGGKGNKFGIDENDVSKIFRLAKKLPNVKIIGLDIQIGSQIPDPAPYLEAIKKLLVIKEKAETLGFDIRYIDLGGGYPVTYNENDPKKELSVFASAITKILKDSGGTIIFEPGRFMVANAGALVTEVLYRKENSQGKKFVIVDAGISELIRPVLYGAYHHILPVKYSRKNIVADIVGPICESSDYFAKDRKISAVEEGGYLAILSAGAYGSVMGSNYNGRLRPPEILVSGKNARLIRKRETFSQFIQNEI